MSTELITVIVPVYKTEQYLKRCVDSILAQTYTNIEVILIDDGSPDGSPILCDELANKYKQIRVVHQKNGGLSAARNTGIECARGKYISFVDSDDYIDSCMLQRLYQMIKKHNADVSMLQYLEVNDKTILPKIKEMTEHIYLEKETEKAFLELKIDSVCVGLYSKAVIGTVRFPVGRTSEDIPFNFQVFRRIKRFVYIPERRYYYYYNKHSISNGCLNKNMFNYLFFRKDIYEYYLDRNNTKLILMAEALYARAAMGLLTRMAVYGITKDLDEQTNKRELQKILSQHKKVFFKSHDIPFTRKLMGFCGLYAYKMLKIAGRILK